jgi:AcrR family transcriptional regulator
MMRMPAAVDHGARRTELVEIAAGLIAREGLDAATVRRLASVTGYSTTVVTYYFPNKRELLLRVYQAAAYRAQARVDASLSADPGNLQGCLEALLPIGDEAFRDWRVNFAFWHLAIDDAAFGAEQRWWTHHEELIERVLDSKNGSSPRNAAAARFLLTLIEGIAVRAAFDAAWSSDRQREFLTAELRRLGE